jgi:phosphoserine phosphatase RsbU/P
MIMNKSIFSNAEEWKAPIMREIGRELIRGESRFREYNIPGRQDHWIYYRNLESNQWSVLVVFPHREMFASLRAMNTMLIFFILAGLLMLILILSGVINRLSRPLVLFASSARTIAEGNFNVTLPRVNTGDEMQQLRDAFAHMQEELAAYMINLKNATAAKEKIESELRIARDIQMAMIPHTFPPFPDLPQIDLFAMLQSAKEVGGDLYDFFIMDKDKFCFAVGDVSGKGVPASLFMAMTRTLLRTIADREQSPATIMESLNRSLAFNNESNMFVTFFLGIIDLRTGEMHFSNAGHNPPVLLSAKGEIKTFEASKSIPLGLFEDFIYHESFIRLEAGDKIFAYTDGVSEAENISFELFGEERMLAVLERQKQAPPRDVIRLMSEAIELFVGENPQSDDITMLAVAFNG